MIRKSASLALLPLLLVACGTARSAPTADDPEPTASPSLTSSTSTATPSSPQSSSATRPLDDFPLARGYPETNGNDESPVVVSDASGVGDLTFCGRAAWSPDLPVAPADLIGTTYTGEAEDSRGRTLVRYEDEELAAKALAMLRVAVEECPEEEEGGTAQVYSGTNRDIGDEAFTITHRFRGDYGFDTGLEVIDLVRVGDLLLVNWEYGEGGGSAQTIESSQREVTDHSDALLPDLCEYAGPGGRD